MVVTVGLHAADSVLLLELVVLDQFGQQLTVPRHFLDAREEAGLAGDRLNTDQIGFHVGVVADVLDAEAFLGVRIQNLSYEILALGRQEFGHLVISAHDLFVQVRGFGVFKGQIASDHGVEDHTRGPDVRLQTVIPLAGDHLGGSIAR